MRAIAVLLVVAVIAGCASRPDAAVPEDRSAQAADPVPISGSDLYANKVYANSTAGRPSLGLLFQLDSSHWREPGTNGLQSAVTPIYDALVTYEVRGLGRDEWGIVEAFTVLDGRLVFQSMHAVTRDTGTEDTLRIETTADALDVQLLVIAAPSTMTNLTLGVELRMGSAVGAGVGGGEASTPGQGSWVEPSFTGGPAKVAAYLENSNTVGGPPNRWMSNVEIEDGRTELPGPLYFGGVRLLAHLVADSPSLATVDLRSTGLGAKPGTWQGIAAFDGERRVHDERMLSPEACASGWLVLGREVAGLDAEFEVTGAYGLGLMWMFAALVPIDLGAWSSGAHMEDVADVVVPTPASSACGF